MALKCSPSFSLNVKSIWSNSCDWITRMFFLLKVNFLSWQSNTSIRLKKSSNLYKLPRIQRYFEVSYSKQKKPHTHFQKCYCVTGTLCQQSAISCITLLTLLYCFMEQITKHLLWSTPHTSQKHFDVGHFCDLPFLPFLYQRCLSMNAAALKASFAGQVAPHSWFCQTWRTSLVCGHSPGFTFTFRSQLSQKPQACTQHCQGTCSFSSSLETSPFAQHLNHPHLLQLQTSSWLSCMLQFYSATNTKVTEESELPCTTGNTELQRSQGNSDLVSAISMAFCVLHLFLQ